MGEWSKKVGEAGENIAAEFLRMIGWDAAQAGVQLPCVRPEVHKVSGHARRTHGIDYLVAYCLVVRGELLPPAAAMNPGVI